jgi:outer membrane protein
LISALLFLTSAFGIPAHAQEVQGTLTLDDAVRLAVRNNPGFLQTANDQSVADWAYQESWGQFLPAVTTSLSGQYLAPGSPSFGIFNSSDLGLAVTDYYFSGYNLNLSYSLSGNSFFRVASAKATQRATEARVRAAEYDLESAVTAQYLIGLRARDRVEVAQRQLERAQENYELAQARVDVGAAIPTDAKQAEVERGRAEVAVLEEENLFRTEKLRLLEQIGVPAEDDFVMVSEFEIFEPEWTREFLVGRALEIHPSLRAYRAQESSGTAQVRQAWSSYFPNLFFQASWSGRARQIGDQDYLLNQARSSVEGSAANCQTWNQISAGLSQPLDDYPRDCSRYVLTPADEAAILANNDVFPFNFRSEPLSLYLQVSLPVFQGFTRQRQVAEARAAEEDARLDRRAAELRVQTAVTQAYDELTTAVQVVEIESRNREVAAEQLELARERYRLGAGAYLELLEAQSSTAAADRDFLDARYRFHGAIWRLEAAVGERLRPDAATVR